MWIFQRSRLGVDVRCNLLRIGVEFDLADPLNEEAGSLQMLQSESDDQAANLDSAVEKLSLCYVLN